jgi:hypothetical protein
MLNEIMGMYLSDKYGITTDRILFTVSVYANDTATYAISDATNGSKLKADLYYLDYFITKYSIWSQNGILDVTIKPDNEAINQLKTQAFTQKTEAQIVPLKHIRTDLTIEVTNSQAIDDDLYLALEIFKIPQDKVSKLVDIGYMLCVSLDNIDIQTLAIEKYVIYSNELLKALILANGGTIPDTPVDIGTLPVPRESTPVTRVCRRT